MGPIAGYEIPGISKTGGSDADFVLLANARSQRQVWLSYLSKHGFVVRWLRHAVRALELPGPALFPRHTTALREKSCTRSPERSGSTTRSIISKEQVRNARADYWRWTWVSKLAIILTFASSALLAAMTFRIFGQFASMAAERAGGSPIRHDPYRGIHPATADRGRPGCGGRRGYPRAFCSAAPILNSQSNMRPRGEKFELADNADSRDTRRAIRIGKYRNCSET